MKDELIAAYDKIWNKYSNQLEFKFTELLSRNYLFQFDEIETPDIVFMGINPSYSGVIDNSKTYSVKNLKPAYLKPFANIQTEVSKKLGRDVTWTHLDCFVFRETAQSIITDDLFKDIFGRQFLKDQLKLSKRLLEHYNPKVIVVSNALARQLIRKETRVPEFEDFGYSIEFSDEIGTDIIIEDGVMNQTSIFFTSMLSGQRALDIGSRERLIWHIAKALKEI
ncbi:MAG: hypothetical protein H6550_14830 [Chitinophagales bacterium]|nr:hypothetical protein [Chitinophagales bacterium]